MSKYTSLRIAGVVQARMSSTRLKKKSLADIHGRPMAFCVLDRLLDSELVRYAAIATSTDKTDDELANKAAELNIQVSRGPLDDIVQRLYLAAEQLNADYLVRAWGDCPLLTSDVVTDLIRFCVDKNLSYASNCLFGRRSYPAGTDIEIYSRKALQHMHKEMKGVSMREFPAEYVLAHTEQFSADFLQISPDLSSLHLTVDYQEDLDAVRDIYQQLHSNDNSFSLNAIIELASKSPELIDAFSNSPRNIEYSEFVNKVRKIHE